MKKASGLILFGGVNDLYKINDPNFYILINKVSNSIL